MVQFNDNLSEDHLAQLKREEEASLIQQLAVQYGLTYVDLRGLTINPEAIQMIPEAEARAGNCVAFELGNKRLSVAIRNPNNPNTRETLATLEQSGYTLQLYMTATSSLEHAWERYRDTRHTSAVKKGVLDIDAEEIARLTALLKSTEAVAEHIGTIRSLNSARRISETLETIFAGAMALDASDIHIEPEEAGIRLRYRLDGVLHDVMDLERKIYERLMSRLKLLSGVVLNIRDEAQDGRFTFSVGERDIEVRSSVIPGSNGESIVMRLLDPTVASFQMEKLGLNEAVMRVMETQLKRPNGMIITTGPTGSGKTTALYAFLQQVHGEGTKIITLENPVEYKLDGIVQTQIGDDFTFSSGLKAILRQDPDVIMVGEIRDREVAETAVHAAQTGHLVFSTLHTNSAIGAFPRLIDLGVDTRVMGSTFNVILGQRLVRKLCEHCKVARLVTPAERSTIERVLAGHPTPPAFPEDQLLYEAGSCEHCNHSGYAGRQSIVEAVVMDQAVEEAILRDPREHIIMEAATPQGIPLMIEDGVEKVLAGVTSLSELARVVDMTKVRRAAPKSAEELENEKLDDDFMSHIV